MPPSSFADPADTSHTLGGVLVRDARSEDWPAVLALLVQLGRPEPSPEEDEATLREVFDRYLQRPDAVALVAEEDGRVVGFMDMELRTRLNFATPQAWIPDLVVDGSARRRGAGAALLARAEEIARERGCWGMTLESATWRTEAHAFYESQGWKYGGKSFAKPLSDRVWPPPPPG